MRGRGEGWCALDLARGGAAEHGDAARGARLLAQRAHEQLRQRHALARVLALHAEQVQLGRRGRGRGAAARGGGARERSDLDGRPLARALGPLALARRGEDVLDDAGLAVHPLEDGVGVGVQGLLRGGLRVGLGVSDLGEG